MAGEFLPFYFSLRFAIIKDEYDITTIPAANIK
jgi:hypothetical protein